MKIRTCLLYPLSLIFFIFNSCSKEEVIKDDEVINVPGPIFYPSPYATPYSVSIYDTLYPSIWLPAYPGSYWIYDNGDTLSSNTWNLDRLRKNSSAYMSADFYPYYHVPDYDGKSVFYDQMKGSNGEGFQFVFDQAGGCDATGNQYHVTYNKSIVMDTSIIVQSIQYDSIQLVVTWGGPSSVPDYPHVAMYTMNYYAKGIGIIRTEFYDHGSITRTDLTDYFINK